MKKPLLILALLNSLSILLPAATPKGVTITPTNIKSPMGCNYYRIDVPVGYRRSSVPTPMATRQPSYSVTLTTQRIQPMAAQPVQRAAQVPAPLPVAQSSAPKPSPSPALVVAAKPISPVARPFVLPAPVPPTAAELEARETKLLQSHRILSEKGYASAQLEMARRYWTGRGVPVDQEQAVDLAQRAAAQRLVQAEKWLANPR